MNDKTFYWSRIPGKFVNQRTGRSIEEILGSKPTSWPEFKGSVREWYETLPETIVSLNEELQAQSDDEITLTVSPDVRCILECSVLLRLAEDETMSIRGMKIREDRSIPNNEVLVEVKSKTSTKSGLVKVLDMTGENK